MATALMPLFRFPPLAPRGVERIAPVARVTHVHGQTPRAAAASQRSVGFVYGQRLAAVKGTALDLSV